MLHIDMTLEDTRLIARGGPDGWLVEFRDSLTGQMEESVCSSTQLAAILFLAVNNGEESAADALMYELAEPIVEGLEKGLRPIP